MKQLGLKGRSWLKGFHIFFSCAWIGTGLSMTLLAMMKGYTANGDELYAFNATIKLLDDFIIIPAAFGSLITGLLFSLFTNWGFFKFKWVSFKWAATVAQILFGTFWLGPWTNGATAIADAQRALAFHDPTYLYDSRMALNFGIVQILLLIAQVFVSVIKPWSRKVSG